MIVTKKKHEAEKSKEKNKTDAAKNVRDLAGYRVGNLFGIPCLSNTSRRKEFYPRKATLLGQYSTKESKP